MRHLALAAALPLLALAAGCSEPCNEPSLTVSWRFELPGGVTDATCEQAGVATVDLILQGDGAPLVWRGIACGQGAATFFGLGAGWYDYTIQGRSAAGALLYQQWGGLEEKACGESRELLRPGAEVLRLRYAIVGDLCYDPADSTHTAGEVWYDVVDRTLGTHYWVDAGSAVSIPCQTSAGDPTVEVTVPYGLYALNWMYVVRPQDEYLLYRACGPVNAEVRGAATDLPVALTAASNVQCP